MGYNIKTILDINSEMNEDNEEHGVEEQAEESNV